jgi:hypothetical protein
MENTYRSSDQIYRIAEELYLRGFSIEESHTMIDRILDTPVFESSYDRMWAGGLTECPKMCYN